MDPVSQPGNPQRELAIIELVARGFSNKEITEYLCISEHTLRWWITERIYKRFGLYGAADQRRLVLKCVDLIDRIKNENKAFVAVAPFRVKLASADRLVHEARFHDTGKLDERVREGRSVRGGRAVQGSVVCIADDSARSEHVDVERDNPGRTRRTKWKF
jgi:hypothetical protein